MKLGSSTRNISEHIRVGNQLRMSFDLKLFIISVNRYLGEATACLKTWMQLLVFRSIGRQVGGHFVP